MAKKTHQPEEAEATDFLDEPPHTQVGGKLVSEIMGLAISEQRFISETDKIAEKLTSEHITQIIAASEREDSRAFTAFKWNSIVRLIVFVMSLLFVGFLLVFFRYSDYFATILAATFSFL